jgi:hypothetical protein
MECTNGLCVCGLFQKSNLPICVKDDDCRGTCKLNLTLIIVVSVSVLVAVLFIIWGLYDDHRNVKRDGVIRRLTANQLGAGAVDREILGV